MNEEHVPDITLTLYDLCYWLCTTRFQFPLRAMREERYDATTAADKADEDLRLEARELVDCDGNTCP